MPKNINEIKLKINDKLKYHLNKIKLNKRLFNEIISFYL